MCIPVYLLSLVCVVFTEMVFTMIQLGKNPECCSAAAAAKSLQSCLILCDSLDGSPPGSAVPGILQARTLEWVAISFSSAWKRKVKVKSLSCVQLLVTPWTAAYQAPPSMGFSRQEYWSGVPSPSPECLSACIQMLDSLCLCCRDLRWNRRHKCNEAREL